MTIQPLELGVLDSYSEWDIGVELECWTQMGFLRLQSVRRIVIFIWNLLAYSCIVIPLLYFFSPWLFNFWEERNSQTNRNCLFAFNQAITHLSSVLNISSQGIVLTKSWERSMYPFMDSHRGTHQFLCQVTCYLCWEVLKNVRLEGVADAMFIEYYMCLLKFLNYSACGLQLSNLAVSKKELKPYVSQ